MNDFFENKKLDLTKLTCHSGGAEGADTAFEKISEKYNIKVNAYSYKTARHKSKNKVEISEEDFKQGCAEIAKANKTFQRWGYEKYINLLARNWSQVKYSNQIFAIATILKPGEKNDKNYYNKGRYDIVDGGTGWAVQMGINHGKEVFVFDQNKNKWFRWSYAALKFMELRTPPKITYQNFAGIGTRNLNENGQKAIIELFERTFQ